MPGGAPKGNKNAATKNPYVATFIRLAAARDDARRLRAAAEALLDNAATGDLQSLQFIADRLDGKPKQSIELGEDPDAPFKSLIANAAKLRDKIRG